MATKKVKDLKKGDQIKLSITNGSIVYLGMCTIDDIHDLVYHDPNALRTAESREGIRKIFYTVDTGKLKGTKNHTRGSGEDIVFVKDPPGYLKRVVKAVFNL